MHELISPTVRHQRLRDANYRSWVEAMRIETAAAGACIVGVCSAIAAILFQMAVR